MTLATVVKQARDAVAIPFNRIFGDPVGDGSRLMDLSGLLDTTASPINPAKEDGNLGTLAGAVAAGKVKTAPQSGIPALDATGPLSASGDAVTVQCAGLNTAIVRLPAGAWTGSIVVEGTADGTYADAMALNVIPYGGGTALSSLTAPGTYEVTITGLAAVRVRATSAITGGPITALVRAATGNKSIRVGAPAANPVPVAPAVLSPTEGATTSQSVTALTSIGSRLAEPNSLGQWYAQNQSASVMFLVFYAGDGTTRLCAIAIDPGAGQGRQGGDASWQTTFGAFKGPMTLFGTAGAQATLTRQ